MNPTSSNFKRHMVARPQFVGDVLDRFVTAGGGSSEWCCNQANPLDVVVHGGAWRNSCSFNWHVCTLGWSDKAVLGGSRLVWP
jgi:hypothetical protein